MLKITSAKKVIFWKHGGGAADRLGVAAGLVPAFEPFWGRPKIQRFLGEVRMLPSVRKRLENWSTVA